MTFFRHTGDKLQEHIQNGHEEANMVVTAIENGLRTLNGTAKAAFWEELDRQIVRIKLRKAKPRIPYKEYSIYKHSKTEFEVCSPENEHLKFTKTETAARAFIDKERKRVFVAGGKIKFN